MLSGILESYSKPIIIIGIIGLIYFSFNFFGEYNSSLRYIKKYTNYNAYSSKYWIKEKSKCLLEKNTRLESNRFAPVDLYSRTTFNVSQLDEETISIREGDGFYELIIKTKNEMEVVLHESFDYLDPSTNVTRYNNFVLLSLKSRPERDGVFLKAHLANLIIGCRN